MASLRRLESFGKLEGLVVGPWGDCSKDLHNMVKVMGENRARAIGREASENELGVIISHIRKYLSTAFIRAQSLCLEQRQQQGEGTCQGDLKWAEEENGRLTSRLTSVALVCPELDTLSIHR